MGSSAATDSTQSSSPRPTAVSRMSRARARIRSSYAFTTRGVKPLLTSARMRVCAGGSVSIIERARRELDRRQILERGAAELRREGLPLLGDPHDVLVARDHPEARPLVLGLPVERCIPAEQGEPVVGDAPLPHVEVGQVDVVEREPVEGWARNRRLRGCRSPHRTSEPRRLPPRGSESDEQRPAVLARLVDRQRLERGRRHHVAGADVELRPVARADHHLPVELAPRQASTPRACTCRRTRASPRPSGRGRRPCRRPRRGGACLRARRPPRRPRARRPGSRRLLAEHVPRPAHVLLGRPEVSDREPQHVAAVELRVREEDLSACVDVLEQGGIVVVRALVPEADDGERPRCARAPNPARRGPSPRTPPPARRRCGSPPAARPGRSSGAPPRAGARGTRARERARTH